MSYAAEPYAQFVEDLLRSLTGGRGTFRATLDHYEEVPAHVAQKVIEAHHKEEAEAH